MANATKPSSQLHILYSEGNDQVLANQAATIEMAGHRVETALGRKAVEQAVRAKSYDWVVLGPTLSKNDRHHLPYMVKKAKQSTRVLVMHTDGEGHPAVDANLDTGATIQDLLAKIAALESKPAMAKGATAPH
jgi:DNA-binding NtrC family response regulator